VDVKHKERKEPALAENKGLFSGIGISVGGGGKFVEQDDVSNYLRMPIICLTLAVVS
jgi:hypothetical protein